MGRVADWRELVPLAELQRPDIALIDGGQRPGETVPSLRPLQDRFPAMRLVVAYEGLSTQELPGLREAGVAAVVPYAHGLGGLLSVLRALAGAGAPPPGGSRQSGRQAHRPSIGID